MLLRADRDETCVGMKEVFCGRRLHVGLCVVILGSRADILLLNLEGKKKKNND